MHTCVQASCEAGSASVDIAASMSFIGDILVSLLHVLTGVTIVHIVVVFVGDVFTSFST